MAEWVQRRAQASPPSCPILFPTHDLASVAHVFETQSVFHFTRRQLLVIFQQVKSGAVNVNGHSSPFSLLFANRVLCVADLLS
jgi:hypothetical protein